MTFLLVAHWRATASIPNDPEPGMTMVDVAPYASFIVASMSFMICLTLRGSEEEEEVEEEVERRRRSGRERRRRRRRRERRGSSRVETRRFQAMDSAGFNLYSPHLVLAPHLVEL
jgi:hypothetical protein